MTNRKSKITAKIIISILFIIALGLFLNLVKLIKEKFFDQDKTTQKVRVILAERKKVISGDYFFVEIM